MERVRDEILKTLPYINSQDNKASLLFETLLLAFIPELLLGAGMKQNKYHDKTVLDHNISTMYRIKTDNPLLKLAALLHDVGKPATRTEGKNREIHFIDHEVKSAEIAREVCKRLKLGNNDTAYVVKLIEEHMYRISSVKNKNSMRKFIIRIGKENLDDWFALFRADLEAGKTKDVEAEVLNARMKLFAVMNEFPAALDPKFLAVTGEDIMEHYNLKPGILVGAIKEILLTSALADPTINTKEKLLNSFKEHNFKQLHRKYGIKYEKGKKK
jgi:poly(A) polymerase/tRNA nucleotidyltransferase (CCA-adding enzyme)